MRKSISLQIKNQVIFRSESKCEYCLLPEKVSFYNFHIDHIRPLKHGGSSLIDNLAYFCPDCNHFEGTDIGSFESEDIIVRFFNPRRYNWRDYFDIIDGSIIGKTEVGRVTTRIFKFNEIDRLIFRKELMRLGKY